MVKKKIAKSALDISSKDKNIPQEKEESEMEKSLKKYKDYYDNSPDMCASVEAKTGKIVDCNNTLIKKLGYSKKDDFVGRFLLSVYHPDCHQGVKKAFDNFVTYGEVNNVELSLQKKNGEKISVILNVTSVRDENGTPVYSRSIWTDVTELNKAHNKVTQRTLELEIIKKELEDLTKRYELILQSAGEGIFGIDLQGVTTFCNPRAAELLGYEAEELTGRFIHSLIQPTRSDGAPYPFEECPIYFSIKKGTSQIVTEENFLKKDGSCFSVEYSSNPTMEKNKIVGAVVLFKDITQRKAAEKELLEAKLEAERANKAKMKFLSSISHELRTPLNAILGFSQILMSRDPSPEKKGGKHPAEFIYESGNHLLELINEVLDLSQIDSGKMSVSIEPLNLFEVFSETYILTKPMADENGIKISNEIIDENLFVLADRFRLKQVLLNLITNAIKYNNPDGSVTFSCKRLPDQILQVKIADTGIGLSEKNLEKLFAPFERLGKEKSKIQGTGIGLVLSKQFAELMNLKIYVKSKIGEGSCFYLELPLVNEPTLNSAKNSTDS